MVAIPNLNKFLLFQGWLDGGVDRMCEVRLKDEVRGIDLRSAPDIVSLADSAMDDVWSSLNTLSAKRDVIRPSMPSTSAPMFESLKRDLLRRLRLPDLKPSSSPQLSLLRHSICLPIVHSILTMVYVLTIVI